MPQPLTKAQKEQLKKLGAHIKAIRVAKGMTLEQVAFAIEKDRQSIYKLEKGLFNPSYIYLTDIARGLEVPLAILLPMN